MISESCFTLPNTVQPIEGASHGFSKVAAGWPCCDLNVKTVGSRLPLVLQVTPSRLEENLQVFDFVLSDDEISELDRLDRRLHFNNVGLPFVWNCPIYE